MSGILTSMFERRALDENSGWGLIKGIRLGTHGYSTPAGVTVTPDRAIQLTAVYAAIRVLAEGLASLPLVTYKRLPGGGKERAPEHPLYELLHSQPNSELTSFMFRETMMWHLCGWGNAYAEIEYNRSGRIVALWPLIAEQTEPTWVNGSLYYVTTLPPKFNNQRVGLPAERVLHIRGLSPNGLTGYSPIKLARRALGLAAATEEYGSTFFGNGAQPGGVLEHPGVLSDEAVERMRREWEEMHSGLENSHRVAILEEGAKYNPISMPPEDSQFIETRKFQISEIARMFRVPPHMLADLDRATFSNIEHMSLEFVNFTLRPWMVRWEQEILRCLMTPDERKIYFAEFLVDGLLRGDVQSRYESYHSAWQDGWITWNEIREKENLNPIAGGDVHYVPLNMMPVGESGGERSLELPAGEHRADDREERSKRSANVRHRLMLTYQPLFEEAAARSIRREAHDLIAGAKRNFKSRSYADFEKWLDEFFTEHQEFMIRQLSGVGQTYAELIVAEAMDEVQFHDLTPAQLAGFVRRYLEALASRHVYDSNERIKDAVARAMENGDDPVEAVTSEVDDWEQTRSASLAKRETTQMNGAVSKLVYAAAGIIYLHWRTFNKSCPYCRSLDGKRVGINEAFLAAGDILSPEGAEAPMSIHSNIGHPPAHDGCDCIISAG